MASERPAQSPKRSINTPHFNSPSHGSHRQTESRQSGYTVAWKKCNVCTRQHFNFKSPREFCQHLRDYHCTKEGGSFVCRYGANNVCPSLPIEGVSDKDYEDHVARDHVASVNAMASNGQPVPKNDKNESKTGEAVTPKQPSIVEDQHKWTIYQSKVNLPAVLNDPRLARRETDFFTKTWGESFDKKDVFPSPHLPEITHHHFRKYLKKTSARYNEHLKDAQAVPVQSLSDPAKSPTHIRAVSPRQKDKDREEIATIPKIFMQATFNLENPDTFSAVFPWSQIEGSKTEGKKQSSKLLQEKLSHYLDVVEVQIAKQISLRSEAFFHAMTSHDALQENMKTTCAAIKTLRSRMQHMDEVLAKGPLHIMKLARSRDNYVAISNKLRLMSTVHQTQPTIQLLLSTNEFVGALDLISTTQEVLAQELQGILCFRHLGSQLLELEKLIDKMMQEDFIKYANQDLNRPLDDRLPVMEEEKLMSIVLGMLRQNKLHFIEVYKEEASTALKAMVKQTVIEAVAEADINETDEMPQSLADQMRLLAYKPWTSLLQQVFSNLLVILNRVKGLVTLIQSLLNVTMVASPSMPQSPPPAESPHRCSTEKDTASASQSSLQKSTVSALHSDTSDIMYEAGDIEAEILAELNGDDDGESTASVCQNGLSTIADHNAATPQPLSEVEQMLSSGECVKIAGQLREMLFQVCNSAHDRCVKLLVARAKDGFLEKLSTNEFVNLSRAVEGFVNDCEAISGRKSTSLRTCLQSQANRFVTRFHEERRNKLSLILDNERWKQNDVPPEFQDLVNHISQSGQLCLPKRKIDFEAKQMEHLVVDGEKYAVVGTVLLLLKMVMEYCQCVDDIPTATPDILNRLVEILKMFNSRTCQLILGAGAVQLVGLRTITTKNLALASRCLQLVIAYIPKVKQHFAVRLQEKQQSMLKHFDQLHKDYVDHVSELTNKLVAIMDSMFEQYLAKWEVKAPMPSVCFRNICKQISKLHEAVVDILPESQVLELFQRVHNSFKIYLRGQLIKLGVCNDGSPQHGLVVSDVAFYVGSVKSLAGLNKLQDNMEDIWDKT